MWRVYQTHASTVVGNDKAVTASDAVWAVSMRPGVGTIVQHITNEMRAQLSKMPDALKQDSMDAMHEYAEHPTSTKDIVASSHSTKFHVAQIGTYWAVCLEDNESGDITWLAIYHA